MTSAVIIGRMGPEVDRSAHPVQFMTMSSLSARRAVSAVEVLLGIGLFVAVSVPVYQLIVSGRSMGFKSRLAYLAVQAAREEMDDLRIAAALAPDKAKGLGHPWQPVTGSLLARLEPLARPGDFPRLTYPAEYARIFTHVELGREQPGGLLPATLVVRWQEKGEDPAKMDPTERQGTSRFDFLLAGGSATK